MKGRIGSIDLKTGNKVWEISTQEGLIFSPPSIYGKTLFVLADCVVYLIDKTTGSVYFKKIIGHSPYSAPIIFNNNLFIGGGEPPLNGVLLSFDIKHSLNEIKNKEAVLKVIEFGNYVENNKMQISIIFEKKVKNVYLDVSVISNDNIIKPIDIKENNYIFEFNLKKNNLSGLYSLPITFEKENFKKSEMIIINLILKETKSKKIRLDKFYYEIKQEKEFYSGAAIAKFILNRYGKDITQEEFRKIINHVKEKSNWKDADFQTWRLILKRVLSTSKNTLEDFLKEEEKNEK